MSTTASPTAMTADEFSERFFGSALGMFDVLAVYLGDRLGWYRALADGPATAEELVARAGGSARYAREWLEQQAATGYLAVTERRPVRAAGRRGRGADRRRQPGLPGPAGPDARRRRRSSCRRWSAPTASGGGVSWDRVRPGHAGVPGRHQPADLPAPARPRRSPACPRSTPC